MKDFEFESRELVKYQRKIREQSQKLIEKIIKGKSPIQIGENVETCTMANIQLLKVVDITLQAVDSFGTAGNLLSFGYTGMLLKANHEIMKNRKPIYFSTFTKNGTKYTMPSYFRIQIRSANMFDSDII